MAGGVRTGSELFQETAQAGSGSSELCQGRTRFGPKFKNFEFPVKIFFHAKKILTRNSIRIVASQPDP